MRRYLWPMALLLVAAAAAAVAPSASAAGNSNNGTALSLLLVSVTCDTAPSGRLKLTGELVSSGSTGPGQFLLSIDGGPQIQIGAISDTDWIADGRYKVVPLAFTFGGVGNGSHTYVLTFVQSGANGRDAKTVGYVSSGDFYSECVPQPPGP